MYKANTHINDNNEDVQGDKAHVQVKQGEKAHAQGDHTEQEMRHMYKAKRHMYKAITQNKTSNITSSRKKYIR